MSRSSSVQGRQDISARRGVEVRIFLGQEGCQDLQEDRRGNQSSHRKSTKLVRNTKKFFLFSSSGVTMKTQECSFRDAESHKERDDGAYLCKETFNLCRTIYRVTSLIPPLSKRCQDPRRLRVVGTYLRGEEGKGNFFKTRRMPRSSRRSTGQPI